MVVSQPLTPILNAWVSGWQAPQASPKLVQGQTPLSTFVAQASYSAADFLAAFLALLPRGPVWPRDPNSVMVQALTGLMRIYERQTQRSNNLLVDAFPASVRELLPEWESTLGLPDPAIGQPPTAQQRAALVLSRFIGSGGQSIEFLEAFTAALGFQTVITNCSPFRMGQSRTGAQLGDATWAHTFYVDASPMTFTSFRMGQSGMGEPLETWGNAAVQAELLDVMPAHTIAIFRFPLADTLFAPFILDSSRLG